MLAANRSITRESTLTTARKRIAGYTKRTPTWNMRSTRGRFFLSVTNTMTWSSGRITVSWCAMSTWPRRTTAPMVVPAGRSISSTRRSVSLHDSRPPCTTASRARAAPQAVNGDHVAAAHVGKQRADGRLRRRDRDVDLARLQQVDVGPAVDEGHHPARAHALGEERAHDVVFVVVGHGDEQIHFSDVLALEQLFVGGVAVQDQRFPQARRDQLAAPLVVLDHPHRVALFEREREPQPDVAAAGDHHPPHRPVHAPQLAHDLADMLGSREAEHFVARLDHRVAVGDDRAVAAENRDDARDNARDVAAQVLQRMAYERPAGERSI